MGGQLGLRMPKQRGTHKTPGLRRVTSDSDFAVCTHLAIFASMAKRIVTIGFELASPAVERGEFTSKTSLLDWDIVLFKPLIGEFIGRDTYKGKPSLSDTLSFELKDACEHWRREIKQAVDSGKTVICFMSPESSVYIDTGKREYSGTGRNRQTTQLVELYSNYKALPVTLALVNASGSGMKLTQSGHDLLGLYWAEFGRESHYEVFLPVDTGGALITTKAGDRPVGAIFRSKVSSGALVLLPNVEFTRDEFYPEEEGEDDDPWTPEAKKFAAKMVGAVVNVDGALHSSAEVTLEPSWASDPIFSMAVEKSLRSELLDAEREVEEAQRRKEEVIEQLRNSGRLRALLYENGKALERAIIEALSVMGFRTSQYKEGESEFDVVFESEEGRLLGEAEGKDNKAINVDKLRQLAMNIHEDLLREEIATPAKGVLFGNGFRLSDPSKRDIQFTTKCVSAATSSGTALITTTDLFVAARYLSDKQDEGYAKTCREALLHGSGIVKMPTPPENDNADGPKGTPTSKE